MPTARGWMAALTVLAACGGQASSNTSQLAASATAQLASDHANRDWSPPVNLGSPINSVDDEFHPALSGDGLTFYFSAARTNDVLPTECIEPSSDPPLTYGGNDLYFSTRLCADDPCPWSTPKNMGPTLNGTGNESGPFPSASADGNYMYLWFASTTNRPGGQGGNDIWRARRAINDPCWGYLVNLGVTVNTTANEADPSLATLNGNTYLFFARGTPYQIYASKVDPTRLDDDDPSGAFGPPHPVNVSVPGYNNTKPTIFNKTMIFASNRPGTCSKTNSSCTADTSCPLGESCNLSQGGPDLWMSSLSPDDTDGTKWSTPVNLGPDVNTSSIERAPFAWVDPTGDLFLYFASTRAGGYGQGGDFYVTRPRAASGLFEQ
jgi:hypothetical protein